MNPNRSLLIVNSDDFGISNSVNEAIARSFENQWISSTTMMASMPGFDDAVARTHSNPLLKNAIGLHMNLTEGRPLSEPIKKSPQFCKNGQFCYDRKKPLFRLSASDKHAVYTEIKAQLQRLIDNGITPTHLDSHHHVHTEFGIMNVYLAVAKEYGIKKVRLTKNVGHASAAKSLYKRLYNTYIRNRFGMTTTDIFCSANEYAIHKNEKFMTGRNIEVMVHAMLNDAGEVVDIDKVNMAAKMQPLLHNQPISSYYLL